VHLVDGTYELFRHHFALPPASDPDGRPIAAVRGVVESVLGILESRDGHHVAVATDHIIESFRNELWAGYKTGAGIDPELWDQFHPLEEALTALGVVVWPMVEYEADDALAAGAEIAAADERVTDVLICTPDKDLAQCVVGDRVVQFDRRKRARIDERGVIEKFGVRPESIPDYLGLVGDAADGFPGLPGWGAKSASAVLAEYRHYEAIPVHAADWRVALRGAAKLAATLAEQRGNADLFRLLATLRTDAIVLENGVDDLRWRGPAADLPAWAERLGAPGLVSRAERLAEKLGC
jgi:5'-3' exonuclease